jgi:putative heme transporter
VPAAADPRALRRPGSARRPPRPLTARRVVLRTIKLVAGVLLVIFAGPWAIRTGRQKFTELAKVNFWLLLVGLLLEFAALIAYSFLTRAALPKRSVPVQTLIRVQFATKALTNVVPAGSAAGSALGYQLLTSAGVVGSDAGFALVTVGLGSALVLNVLLWLTLLVSIPLAGWNPLYVTLALIGLFVFGVMGGVIFALMRGQEAAERWVRSVARRVRFLDEDRMGELVVRLARRLRDLVADRELLRRLVVWAGLNWLLDAAALWVFFRAFGVSLRPDSLLVAFCAGNVMAAIPIMPGGLGQFDATLITIMSSFGYGGVAAVAIVPYRVAQYLLPIPVGGICYLSLRLGPWRIDTHHRLRRLEDEAAEVLETGESVYDWAERYGVRVPVPGRDAHPSAHHPDEPAP